MLWVRSRSCILVAKKRDEKQREALLQVVVHWQKIMYLNYVLEIRTKMSLNA